jgi:hypothetical protein
MEAELYQYAVILQAKEDKDGEIVEESKLVVDLQTCLAKDQGQAAMIAARAIPEEFMDRIDRLTVAVRPF